MSFLSNPQGGTPAEFETYISSIKWAGWKPKFVVLHNTAEPNLRQWAHDNTGKDYEHKRVVNLNRYYRDDEGWHSGPHLFISPSLIWVACDLRAYGVHASCYNSESIGVEMVGDYSEEDFNSGDGAKVRDNTVAALAILHHALGFDPDTLHFHKECIRDHHDCPGKNIDKADVIARVRAYLGGDQTKQKTSEVAEEHDVLGGDQKAAGGGSNGGGGVFGSYASPEPAKVVDPTPAQTYYEKAATIYKFWLAAGLTPAQACGLLAQADAESSLDPNAVGDDDQAFGLDQWHVSRVDAIRNGCGVDLRKHPPLVDQLKAALWELTHTEKHALNQIKVTKTAFDAGYAACRFWERPAYTAQYAKRGNTAEKWAVYFSKHPV